MPNRLHGKVQSYLSSIFGKLNKVVIFGGEVVVPTKLVNDYLQAIPIVTIKDEAQLVTILNTRSNYVSALYNNNHKVLGLALSQLAGHLGEIEKRLNDSNFTYGDNLINAIKNTDNIISGINIQKKGLTKTGSADYDYTHTIKVLNSVKAKVGIQKIDNGFDQIVIDQAVEFIAQPKNLKEENWLTKLAGGLDKPVSVTYGVLSMNKGDNVGSKQFIKLSGPNGSEQLMINSASFSSDMIITDFWSAIKIVDNRMFKDFDPPIKSLTLSCTLDDNKRFKSISLIVSDGLNIAEGSWNKMSQTSFYNADIATLKYDSIAFPRTLWWIPN